MVQWLPCKKDVLDQFIINNVLMLIAVVILGLRLVSRKLRQNNLGADDYSIVAAMPFVFVMLTVQGLYARLGAGYFIKEVPFPNLIMILQLLIVYELFYALAILLIKLSILFFYLRVFVNPGVRIAAKVIFVISLLWSLSNVLQVFLLCRPFRHTWDPLYPGTCGNRQASFISIGAFNAVSDLAILTLPIPTVWKLQMPTNTKVALTGVFCIGFIVTAVAIVRMVSLAKIDFNNLTGTMVYPSFWSTTELILGVMSVCLPMLHPILTFLFPSRFKQRNTTTITPSQRGISGKSSKISKTKSGQSSNKFERLPDGLSANDDGDGDGDPGSEGDRERAGSYQMGTLYAANNGLHGESNVVAATYPGDTMSSTNTLTNNDGPNLHEADNEPLRTGAGISVRKDFEVRRSDQ